MAEDRAARCVCAVVDDAGVKATKAGSIRFPTKHCMLLLVVLYLCEGYHSAAFTPRGTSSASTVVCSAIETNLPGAVVDSFRAPQKEIDRRRNVAIISHPDSGKTTMTEKLLLYGGAIQQAGAVRQKADQRSTASDFMEIEKERGISISSTVMNFDYRHFRVNILDTPGHQDFSEDTYRALAAADNALMLLDAAKGLEPQTRKLFQVCRMRNLPLFTFVNKMDRPSLSPYQIMDQIQHEFGVECHPIVWPIGDGDQFKGLLDRMTNIVHLYHRPTTRGGKADLVQQVPLHDVQTLRDLLHDDVLLDKLLEDAEILNELLNPLDTDRMLGKNVDQSPMFFGSAMTNFGVQLFLDKFCALGTKPSGRLAFSPLFSTNARQQHAPQETLPTNGRAQDFVPPEYAEFTGFIFKTQANLDPKHRDRLAYVRIVSGIYQKGMKVGHSRSKPNKRYNLAQAQALFGSSRESVEVAYPGDVIGINNPGNFAIGDTLYSGGMRVEFPGIPSFSPEKFAYIRNPNPSSTYKAFQKGLDQLLDEGAVQALRMRRDGGGGPMILAAVGQLQFEVVQARLRHEYSVESVLEPLGYTLARWANGGWDAVDRADADGKLFGSLIVQDRWKRPVLLFRNDWKAESVTNEEKYLDLIPWSEPPIIDS